MPMFQACVVKHLKNDSSESADFSSKENFHKPIFFWENCFRRVSVRNLLEWIWPPCKNIDVNNKCFFS